MNGGTLTTRLIGIALVAPLIAACRADEPRMAGTRPDTMPPIGEVATDPATRVDPALLRREADAIDRHVLELRTHIQTMRQLSPAMTGTVLSEHAAHVRAIDARVAASREALPSDDYATMTGMGADEYRVFLEEIREAGAEVAELQRGDEAAIRARMPGHLDRLERLAGQMEQMATHLRR